MTKAQIKKELTAMENRAVISLVMDLYDAYPDVRENLENRFSNDEESRALLLEKYKRIIQAEYFPAKGSEKCRVNICKKAISDFKKLKPEAIDVAELMVFFVEQGCRYTHEFGDMWESFYTAFEKNYRAALSYIFEHGLQDEFKDRMEDCLRLTEDCGWGFNDTLGDYFYEFYDFD